MTSKNQPSSDKCIEGTERPNAPDKGLVDAPSPTSFVNPYHFLPLPDSVSEHSVTRQAAEAILMPSARQTPSETSEDDLNGAAHLQHDQYIADSPSPDDQTDAKTQDLGEKTGKQKQENGLLSGRIVCQLTTVSPCVFGNLHKPCFEDHQQTRRSWTQVLPYEIDGKPAIAATTLRGCISSLVEAISGSSMRVLQKRRMSFRSEMRNARMPIGMIVEKKVDGKKRRFLLPLTFPPVQRCFDPAENREADKSFSLPLEYPDEPWRIVFENGGLDFPVYVDGYSTSGKPHRLECPTSFLDNSEVQSFSSNNRWDFWFLPFSESASIESIGNGPLKARGLGKNWIPGQSPPNGRWERGSWKLKTRITEKSNYSRKQKKKVSRNIQTDFLLTRFSCAPGEQTETVVPVRQEDATSAKDIRWSVGIIRRLAPPRSKDIKVPSTKKHELFIPIDAHYDVRTRQWAVKEERLLSAEDAITQFQDLANTLADIHQDDRPIRLLSQSRGKVKLRHGDLVHFRLAKELDESDQPVVDSVAISAIWREDAGDLYEYFERAELRELLPWNPHREHVTPAEQMFGLVDGTKRSESMNEESRLTAYAGRVRVSTARLDETSLAPDSNLYLKSSLEAEDLGRGLAGLFPLRILSSPKPPCPEFYFCNDSGTFVSRLDANGLDNIGNRPRGWKVYLHDPQAIDGVQYKISKGKKERVVYTWETCDLNSKLRKQKMLVRPVPRGVPFCFHIDFDNLQDHELALLLNALRPTSGFHHKIGLGKPIGLGSVKIGVQGVFLIDRISRYKERLNLIAAASDATDRYDRILLDGPDESVQLSSRYAAEIRALETIDTQDMNSLMPSFRIPKKMAKALETIGNPEHVRTVIGTGTDTVVSYPFTFDRESMLYDWFVKEVTRINVKKGESPLGLSDLPTVPTPIQKLPCRRTDKKS